MSALDNRISSADAIEQHWEAIKPFLNGDTSVNVGLDEGEDRADASARVDDGVITQLRLPSGKCVTLYAEIDVDGEASGVDVNGKRRHFTLDLLCDPLADDALGEWALILTGDSMTATFFTLLN